MAKAVVFLVAAFLAIFLVMSAKSQDRVPCKRPKNNFDNLQHVTDYIECLKSHTAMRYGKRSLFPPLIRKMANDYDYYLPSEDKWQLYDLLKYDDNEKSRLR